MKVIVVIDLDVDKKRLDEKQNKDTPFITTTDSLVEKISGVLYKSNAKIVDVIAGVSVHVVR